MTLAGSQLSTAPYCQSQTQQEFTAFLPLNIVTEQIAENKQCSSQLLCLSFAHLPCSNPSICTLVIIHHKPLHPASMCCFRQPVFPTIPALLNAHCEINFEEETIVYLFCFSQTRVQVKLNGQPTSETGCKSILKTTALEQIVKGNVSPFPVPH